MIFIKKVLFLIMTQTITVKDMDYLVTDEETITKEDEMIFEVRSRRESDATFVVGQWDDLLGSPIQKVWKVVSKTKHRK